MPALLTENHHPQLPPGLITAMKWALMRYAVLNFVTPPIDLVIDHIHGVPGGAIGIGHHDPVPWMQRIYVTGRRKDCG